MRAFDSVLATSCTTVSPHPSKKKEHSKIPSLRSHENQNHPHCWRYPEQWQPQQERPQDICIQDHQTQYFPAAHEQVPGCDRNDSALTLTWRPCKVNPHIYSLRMGFPRTVLAKLAGIIARSPPRRNLVGGLNSSYLVSAGQVTFVEMIHSRRMISSIMAMLMMKII